MNKSVCVSALVLASGFSVAQNADSFVDAPRLFNDFAGSNLTFTSDYGAGLVEIAENNYGSGGFANRHVAWFANGGNKVDIDYGDGFTIATTMQVLQTGTVGNIEAGIQADLFGFGFFGALTANGEIAAFGSTHPFHSFGTGLYNLGDDLMLEMVYTPGGGEFDPVQSTMEYRYNNLTTGSGWVSSGQIAFTNLEGGIPSAFTQFYGVGAQINQPGTDADIGIRFTETSMVPSPGTAALIGLGGLVASRRRR